MIHVDGTSTVASNVPLKLVDQYHRTPGTLPASIFSSTVHSNHPTMMSSTRPQTLQHQAIQNPRSMFSQQAIQKLHSLSPPPPNTPNTVNSYV